MTPNDRWENIIMLCVVLILPFLGVLLVIDDAITGGCA